MNSGRYWRILPLLLLLLATACTRIVTDSNFLLAGGERVSGSLIIPSANVNLVDGSQVEGAVFLLCCNLMVSGRVDGSVFLLSGNLTVGPTAIVAGNVTLGEGNLQRISGAQIGGEVEEGISAGLLARLFAPLCLLAALPFLLAFLGWRYWRRRSLLAP